MWKLDFFFTHQGNNFKKKCVMNNFMPNPLNIHTKFGSVLTKSWGIESSPTNRHTIFMYISRPVAALLHGIGEAKCVSGISN